MSDATVAVVGAGPCGLAAAIALEEAGIGAIVFDRSCLVSSISGYPWYLTFFSTPERLEIGGVKFESAGEKPTRREGLAYYRDVARRFDLRLRLYENVEAITRQGAEFVVHSLPPSGERLATRVRAVVIATGYFGEPNLIGVPGEELPHVTHHFREGHQSFQQDALVVGGGNSAVECAIDLWKSQARVTFIHFGPTFDHVIKPWILPEFEKGVAAGAIAIRWNTRVTSIDERCVHLATENGSEAVTAQHVYLMTGYTPVPGLLGELGVPFDDATGIPAHDKATMETPVPGVFVAGVLTSGNKANSVFIENGRGHGALIARALASR